MPAGAVDADFELSRAPVSIKGPLDATVVTLECQSAFKFGSDSIPQIWRVVRDHEFPADPRPNWDLREVISVSIQVGEFRD
jgi:hypothetical protein